MFRSMSYYCSIISKAVARNARRETSLAVAIQWRYSAAKSMMHWTVVENELSVVLQRIKLLESAGYVVHNVYSVSFDGDRFLVDYCEPRRISPFSEMTDDEYRKSSYELHECIREYLDRVYHRIVAESEGN